MILLLLALCGVMGLVLLGMWLRWLAYEMGWFKPLRWR
jgi:hypothetical protein